MRALILAAAMACAGTAASAGSGAIVTGQGDQVPVALPTPQVPDGAKKQAKDALIHAIGDQRGVIFGAVRALEAKEIRRDAFAQPVEGPLSVVCGQFKPADPASGAAYAWFLVAIKQGRILWTTYDVAGGYTEAYFSCRKAGLTDATAHTGGFW